jgi:hypothetical protein
VSGPEEFSGGMRPQVEASYRKRGQELHLRVLEADRQVGASLWSTSQRR